MTGIVSNLAVEDSCSQNLCTEYIERLNGDLEGARLQLNFLNNKKKKSAKDKSDILTAKETIDRLRHKINQGQRLQGLKVGSLVQRHKKPGEVKQIKITGDIPEVMVLWDDSQAEIPEDPLKLEDLDPGELRYVWKFDNQKYGYVRILDEKECSNHAELQTQLYNMQTCLELGLDNGAAKAVIDQYTIQVNYLEQRLKEVDREDFDTLERKVKQGFEIYYKIGKALFEICDRKLYKQQGYSSFEDYLIERWKMSKPHAYRLINSSKVADNLSVSNWRQSELPEKEAQTRELAKLPPEKQSEVWEKATETTPQPTAKAIKKAAQELEGDPEFPFDPEAKQLNLLDPTTEIYEEDNLISHFEVGQLCKITSDRTDDRLIGYQDSYCLVTAVNEISINVKIYQKELKAVSPNDLQIIEDLCLPSVSTTVSTDKLKLILALFDDFDDLINCAIAAKKPWQESKELMTGTPYELGRLSPL